MKAFYVLASVAATLLAGCTVYNPTPVTYTTTPSTVAVAPTYVSPTYVAPAPTYRVLP
jgi:hypothetical protein